MSSSTDDHIHDYPYGTGVAPTGQLEVWYMSWRYLCRWEGTPVADYRCVREGRIESRVYNSTTPAQCLFLPKMAVSSSSLNMLSRYGERLEQGPQWRGQAVTVPLTNPQRPRHQPHSKWHKLPGIVYTAGDKTRSHDHTDRHTTWIHDTRTVQKPSAPRTGTTRQYSNHRVHYFPGHPQMVNDGNWQTISLRPAHPHFKLWTEGNRIVVSGDLCSRQGPLTGRRNQSHNLYTSIIPI